ncbi:MAG: sulfite exporter TauE/SafE family protein [Balneolaceae bacterium]|nr:MAG: sulfite exporter TauE/SafE family protein [Balneolaceae bacterium]
MIFLLLILLGILAGVVAGLFGLGGGVLFTPILFLLFSAQSLPEPAIWAIATSLFCTFTASVSSSIQQRNQRNFYWKEGLTVGLLGSIGVYAGRRVVLSEVYTEEVFVVIFSVLMLIVASLFYQRGQKRDVDETEKVKGGFLPFTATGSLGGFVASLAGVGGGVVMVPAMNLILKLKMAKAVSISSLAIVFISLSGWLQYAFLAGNPAEITDFKIGYVDFGTGLPLIFGAFIGGFLGVRIGKKVPQRILQLGFSILIVIIVVLMVKSIL